MTGFEIFTLVLVIVFVAASVAYQFSKHHASLHDMMQDEKEIEVQEEEVVKPKKKKKYYPKKPKTSI